MKKILILVFIFLLCGCKNDVENKEMSDNNMFNEIIKITIDNQSYDLNLIDNETSRAFINMLPLNITMKDLNNNEKYYYLSSNLPTNDSNPKTINKGDVMIYNGNCLVIFYKSFNTSYPYTKIGHIDNLNILDDSEIDVLLEK